MMDGVLAFLLIIAPILLAFIMLVFLKKAADVTGIVVWLVTVLIAIFAFQTDVVVALTASVAGIVNSFPISLMVATSILMMTYMQETGALQRLIVFFKTLGGGSRSLQIMIINLGLGLFLVGIGATPVTMLPPVMLALGFNPLVAVALPAIGYDPLTTFALLGVPATVFWGEYNYNPTTTDITLSQAGSTFAIYMPIVTTGIALSMLWIAGGRKLLVNREGVLLAVLCGVTAGGTAIVANSPLVNQTTLTNVFAGAAVIVVLLLYTKIRKRRMIERSTLNEQDLETEKKMSLSRASIPWAVLVLLCLGTNLIPPVRDLLFYQLKFPIAVPGYPIAIDTRFLWQAYTLMLLATVISVPFFKMDRPLATRTFSKFMKRAPRPVLAAAIFFSMAEVLNFSGYVLNGDGPWTLPVGENNMIYMLAKLTSDSLGHMYPLTAAFLGLLAGFVSGSEASAIKMFTQYHIQTSNLIGANALVVSASNGIGGGLASVLSPAKIQNAAAVIDKIGIEGQVIRYGVVVAFLMTLVTAVMTMIWAFG